MRSNTLRRATAAAMALSMASAAAACSYGGSEESASLQPVGPSVLPTTVFDTEAPPALEPGPPAPTPVAAIDQFVAGEAANDAEASWSIMSAADRTRFPTPAMWRSERAQLPRVVSVQLTGQEAQSIGDGRIEILTPVGLQPALDPVNGLVAAASDATWVLVNEDGGWRLSYGQTAFRPRLQLGSDANVPDAAVEWAEGRQRCTPAVDGSYEHEVTGGVVGIAGLANRLCRTSGAIAAGVAKPLSGTDAQSVIAAFGPEAVNWARVVPLVGPTPMRAVLGPLGEEWIVVGVLAA